MTFSMTLTDPNPVFKVTAFSKSIISNTQGQSFYRTLNRKPYAVYRMVPLSMTLSDL